LCSSTEIDERMSVQAAVWEALLLRVAIGKKRMSSLIKSEDIQRARRYNKGAWCH
jgi:hypothetical protein